MASAKLTGREKFGADGVPADALWIRVVRSPHARARFTLGDLEPLRRRLAAVLTAADVPSNGFGIYPDIKDQPVLADGQVRYRGEAVVALVGERDVVLAIRDEDVPITWTPEPPVVGLDAAMAADAPLVQADKPRNLLLEGGVRRGKADEAFATCAAVAEGVFETAFVEHAYIEPEAGWAERVGDRIEIHVSTQTPYMDRDEVAIVMRLRPEAVRIVPTACGGGFGGKLDLSVQPLVALAAWKLRRPVALVYTRPESMAASTKRHPARIAARFGCDAEGRLLACEVDGELRHRRLCLVGADRRQPRAGARHGPLPRAQRAHLGRCLVHQRPAVRRLPRLRRAAGRHRPRGDDGRAGRQARHRSPGVPPAQCAARRRHHGDRPDAGPFRRPRRSAWKRCGRTGARRRTRSRRSMQQAARKRRGVGVGCMWYGIGNTSMSNPSCMRVGLSPAGTLTLYSGAVDIGQGSNTIMTQIAADALGLPAAQFALVDGRHRSHRRCRQDLGLAPDLRLRQGGRARRPRPAPPDPAPGQCRAGGGAVARRRQAHGARRRRGARDRSRARRVR